MDHVKYKILPTAVSEMIKIKLKLLYHYNVFTWVQLRGLKQLNYGNPVLHIITITTDSKLPLPFSISHILNLVSSAGKTTLNLADNSRQTDWDTSFYNCGETGTYKLQPDIFFRKKNVGRIGKGSSHDHFQDLCDWWKEVLRAQIWPQCLQQWNAP